MLNKMLTFNDVGWLSGREDWWARWYVWSAVGAALAVLSEAAALWKARRRSEEMRRAAELLGFKYIGAVSRDRYPGATELPIFRKWQAAENCAAGEIAGEPVEILDFTYREKGSGDSSDRDYRQTIALLSAGENWPAFELQPRGLVIRIATGALGYDGIALESDNLIDAPTYESFRSAYFLSGSADISSTPEQESPTDEEANAVAHLLSPKAVRYFAEHPGWRLQCDGRRLAIWRSKRLVPGRQLSDFVREAAEIRGLLSSDAATDRLGRIIPPTKLVPAGESSEGKAKAAGTAIGAIGGFFGFGVLGMFGAGAIFIGLGSASDSPAMFFLSFALAAVVFFGGAIGGLAAGAWVGSKSLSPLFLTAMERKRQQVLRENPGRPADQPLESDARVETRRDGMTVELPPVGLRRAGGCFLLLWCILWNGFIAIFTAAFLPAAFAGKMEWNGGPETASPWFAVAFLTPFWAVGLGILLFLVHRGRRRATLRVEDGRLFLFESTLFGSQQRSWLLADIADIRAEFDPNIKPPRRKIVIELTKEPPAKILRYRPHEEVNWLASELRRILGRGEAKLKDLSQFSQAAARADTP
jgi:hypothetical protein